MIKITFISKHHCSFVIGYYHLFSGVERSFVRYTTPFLITGIFDTRLIIIRIVEHLSIKWIVLHISVLPNKSPSSTISCHVTIDLRENWATWTSYTSNTMLIYHIYLIKHHNVYYLKVSSKHWCSDYLKWPPLILKNDVAAPIFKINHCTTRMRLLRCSI